MAYFTGRDVSAWVTTEHLSDGVGVSGAPADSLMVLADATTQTTPRTQDIIPALAQAGDVDWQISNLTGLDVSIGAQDEDISFIGLRNVGKIEVKKDTSITFTKKKNNAKFSMLFQGKTASAHSASGGNHSGRYGLIAKADNTVALINDGTVDPKTTLDETGNQCFGYRVFVELKAESAVGEGDGEVLCIPNCHFMEYGHTVSNESANEETFTLQSQVKPFLWDGTKTAGLYIGNAITQTASTSM